MTLLFAILSSKAIVESFRFEKGNEDEYEGVQFERTSRVDHTERETWQKSTSMSPDNSGSTLKDRWVLNLVLCFRLRPCAHVIRGYVIKVCRVAQMLE